jgi:hypothetical protein
VQSIVDISAAIFGAQSSKAKYLDLQGGRAGRRLDLYFPPMGAPSRGGHHGRSRFWVTCGFWRRSAQLALTRPEDLARSAESQRARASEETLLQGCILLVWPW